MHSFVSALPQRRVIWSWNEERAALPSRRDHLQPLITGPDTRPPMENPPFETHPRYISPIFLGGGSFLFWILEILGYKRSFFNPSCESSTRKFLCTFSKLIFLMKKDKLLCWKIWKKGQEFGGSAAHPRDGLCYFAGSRGSLSIRLLTRTADLISRRYNYLFAN